MTDDREEHKVIQAEVTSQSEDGVRVLVMQVETGEHVVAIEFSEPIQTLGLDCMAAAALAHGIAEASARALALNREAIEQQRGVIVVPGVH